MEFVIFSLKDTCTVKKSIIVTLLKTIVIKLVFSTFRVYKSYTEVKLKFIKESIMLQVPHSKLFFYCSYPSSNIKMTRIKPKKPVYKPHIKIHSSHALSWSKLGFTKMTIIL